MVEKNIQWNSDNGSISLITGGAKERLILMRKGFMEAFFEEIGKVEGEVTLKITLRNLLTRLGASQELIDKPNLESYIKFCDDFFLPINYDPTQVPDFFNWDGKGREIKGFGDAVFMIVPLKALMMFKEVSAELLTERGAAAIIKAVSRRAGLAVGEDAMSNYGWKEIDTAVNSMDGALSYSFPNLGWGKTRVAVNKDSDGNYTFYLKSWNTFESHNLTSKSPVCTILQHNMEGIGLGISRKLTDKSSESKEVKCRAKGDDYCAFAIKQKGKDVKALDWSEFEDECRALDAVYATPDG
jgi:predicted hydrocarbon binding protein